MRTGMYRVEIVLSKNTHSAIITHEAAERVKPIWASEIEEFPIAVTKKHFPEVEE